MINIKLTFSLALILMTVSGIANDQLVLTQSVGASSGAIVERANNCSTKLDRSVLKDAEQKGLRLNKKILHLCANNQRNSAQNIAMGFSLEVQKSTDLLNYRWCNQEVAEPTTNLQKIIRRYFISRLRFSHICDDEST
ncbi:MAG TPA: hypothetical protein EYQ65_02765 [Cycloclasticus sp.]|jgi:hypothetical protein|nr:hypothetical protein [Cycloclasticus sp.]